MGGGGGGTLQTQLKLKVPRSAHIFISGGGGATSDFSAQNLPCHFLEASCITDSLSHTTYVETNKRILFRSSTEEELCMYV